MFLVQSIDTWSNVSIVAVNFGGKKKKSEKKCKNYWRNYKPVLED